MGNLFFPQLSSGAIAQYPIRKTIIGRTIRNLLPDGSLILYPDTDAKRLIWQLGYNALPSEDLNALNAHFTACQGRLQAFTFIDPTDNMLSNSANLLGGPWVRPSSLSMTANIADPSQGAGAFSATNNGQASQELSQTLAVPAGYQYCFSIYVRSAEPAALSLIRRGSVTATSPARFEIPYQTGTAIQISGRAANVANQEAAADLCPLTRCTLGGRKADIGIAGIPNFSLTAPGAGALTLSQVGFNDLSNTSSVTSGTLQLYVWNELLTPSPYSIGLALDSNVPQIQSAQSSNFSIGDVIQIGSELMTILSSNSGTNVYTVARGSFGSSISPHSSGDAMLLLSKSLVIVPFASGFFENRASQNFIHTFSLPDHRVSAAQFSVTNSFGAGLANVTCYASGPETGLRTLSGGQFSFQVSGFLNTQQNAAPQLVVEAGHAVRDIRATLVQAATGYTVDINLLQNGNPYCSLEIGSGSSASTTIVDGVSLLPLVENAILTMNVSVTPVTGFTGSSSPGRDLTVTVRL